METEVPVMTLHRPNSSLLHMFQTLPDGYNGEQLLMLTLAGLSHRHHHHHHHLHHPPLCLAQTSHLQGFNCYKLLHTCPAIVCK